MWVGFYPIVKGGGSIALSKIFIDMKRSFILAGAAVCWSMFATAQHDLEKDREAIRSLCGCFEVQFNFAETFSPDAEYAYKERYNTQATEFIFVDDENDQQLILQHLLLISDGSVIKHWRQDWAFEQARIFEYRGNRRWDFVKVSQVQRTGAWTQKVYEVNDAPRYSASARWVHSAEFPYWEAIANAPLPRREYTKRSDYQVLRRNNRHAITADGHVHDQDNEKLIVHEDGTMSLLVNEKGFVTYRRTDDQACANAVQWWEENKAFWRVSRKVWEEVLSNGNQINMAFKVNGKMFHEALAELATNAPADEQTLEIALKSLILSFVSKEGKL